jgi:hypothetical protein
VEGGFQVWYIWYIARIFVNATITHTQQNNKTKSNLGGFMQLNDSNSHKVYSPINSKTKQNKSSIGQNFE